MASLVARLTCSGACAVALAHAASKAKTVARISRFLERGVEFQSDRETPPLKLGTECLTVEGNANAHVTKPLRSLIHPAQRSLTSKRHGQATIEDYLTVHLALVPRGMKAFGSRSRASQPAA